MALSAELTAKEFADLVGIGTRQVDNLIVEGLPRVRRGKRFLFPAAKCVQWYLAHKLERAKRGDRQPAGARDSNAKDRKLTAEARLAELDVAEREQNLVAIDTYELELSGILQRIRARLLSAGQKYAPRIVGLRSIPEAVIALEPCLNELMAECTRTADDVEAGEHVAGGVPHAPRNPPRRSRRTS